MAIINGTPAVNTLTGTKDADTLNGLGGNDILIGGAGADVLDGGSDTDTASYTNALVDVFASLANPGANTGDAAGDTYVSIENLAGSKFNDTLEGDGAANKLIGNAGNDTLRGGKGDDTLDGGAGDDLLEGGQGEDIIAGGAHTTGIGDTVDYSNSAGAVQIDLTKQGAYSTSTGLITGANVQAQSGGDAQGDLLSGIENVIGTAGNDTVTGDALANIIEGGAGADTLDGGLGINTVSYRSSQSGVFVNLTVQDGVKAQVAKYDFGSGEVDNGDAAGDILKNFQNFIGSEFNDVVQGSTAANKIEGLGGNDDLSGGEGVAADYLDGGDGDDNLFGGSGGDTLIGGLGNDWASYNSGANTVGITITLGKDGTLTGFSASGGDATGDKLTGIENIAATGKNDILTGNNLANELFGDEGDDILEGLGGADSLDGGEGGETFGDTLSYAKSTAAGGVSVNLATSKAGNAGALASDAGGDTIANFEHVTGSVKNDILIGDAGDNVLDGGAGDDVLAGGAGKDQLIGGAHGTTGGDTAEYSSSAAGVNISLLQQGTAFNLATKQITGTALKEQTGGDAEGDKLFGIENVIGSANADSITGDAKNNVIEGGAGSDTLDGGIGIDTLSYASSASGVTVTLNDGLNALAEVSGGDAAADQAKNFENILGSANADTLTGNAVANTISGGGGNDFLAGGGGTDLLIGGDGDDTLSGGLLADKLVGGDGIDTADYSASAAAVTIDLSKQGAFDPIKNVIVKATAQKGGDATGDLFSGIENVIGSAQNDVFIGGAGANKFTGGGGALDTVTYAASATGLTIDMVVGANGTGEAKGDTFDTIERLIGTNFNDRLVAANSATILDGGTGDDTLVSGDGADSLVGGAGIDTASYSNAGASVTVDLSLAQGIYSSVTGAITGAVAQGASTGGDLFSSIENATGSGFNDTLIGNAGANRLDGGGGNDDLQGGLGDDSLEGGDGFDTANYSTVATAVTANLATHKATGAGIGTDTLSNIERLVGTALNDTLTGDEYDNELVGGDGDDVLDGGAGADSLIGGDGVDKVTYLSAASGVTLSLKTPANSSGDAAGDTFTGIEIVIGSNFADYIQGDDAVNNLQGGKGNDVLDGEDGADLLEGGDGDDVLIGGALGDTLNGGAGSDTASYETAGSGVKVTIGGSGTGDASGDTFISIENLIGSQYDDELTGDDGDNVLTGGAGADVLTGGGGTDSANYSNANAGVTVDLDAGTGSAGDAAGDIYIGIRNAIGTSFDDVLVGDATANALSGGLGDDVLEGGGGDDLLDGGAGVDTARYSGAANGVTVNLSTNSATGVDIGTDKLVSIENVVGSDQGDIIIGNNNVNRIDGGKGDDTLTGGDSGDTFIIRSDGGNDTITDFNSLDVLDFSNVAGVTNFAEAQAKLAFNPAGVFYDFGGGNSLLFSQFPGFLTEANFAFAPTDLFIDGNDSDAVDENLAIGGVVGKLTATDDHDTGEALTYKIDSDPSGLFEIKNDQLLLKGTLDYETATSHAIVVRVYDSSGASYAEGFTINVNDKNDAPTNILISNDTITEIAAVGDVVGTLSAADQDQPGDTFTYTLLDDAGGLFSLSGNQIKVAGALDFEGAAVHSVTIQVDDGNGGKFTRSIDINIEDAVEGFGVDGYISGADVFYDADDDETKDGGEQSTVTDANGQFALAAGGSGDLVLIGGNDISTGFAFHGIMKAPNSATVITPLTTLWAYLEDQYADLATAEAATLTALGITGPIDLKTYDPVTAALSSDSAISGPGASRLKSAMQVQHTIALLAGVLFLVGAPNYADDAAEALAKSIFDDPGIEQNFGDLFFMQTVLGNAESITSYDLSAVEGDAAQVMAAIGAAIENASDTGLDLVEYLAQIAAVVHLAATDFETGNTANVVADYTGGALDALIAAQSPANVEGLNKAEITNGTADADTIYGFGGADELNGLAGNDVLDGGEGDDILNGGDGRDVLIGGVGNDKIDGGSWADNTSGASAGNFDIVSYAYSSAAVTVDLGKGTATEAGGTDTITHVEGVIGSAFDDVLTGGANDFIETFQGGKGNDTIIGGTGIDRAIYSDSTAGGTIAVSLAAGSVGTDTLGTDSLFSVEEVVGTSKNDIFNATGFGVFSFNAGSRGTYNAFRPGDDDDLIIGNGDTMLDYIDGARGISIDLATGKFAGGAGFGTDTFSGVNRVRGTMFDDVLIGGQDAYGQPGVSEVYTGAGGNDLIIGGSGYDVSSYAFANGAYSVGITVNLAAGTVTGDAVQVGNDTLRGIEGIVGTAEADTYNAVGFSTTSVNARAFNILTDDFEGGAGNDIIVGSGNTRVSYINATAGMTIDLSAGLNGNYFIEGNASVGKDTIQGGVMSVRATHFDDKLIGFDNADGTAQFFEPGMGDDLIDGRGGYDVVNYLWDSSVRTGVYVLLKDGIVRGLNGSAGFGVDTLLSVEGVRGTNLVDVFDATGFSSAAGPNKGSVINGISNFNTFEGGGGNDVVTGNGATRVDYASATSGVTVTLNSDNTGKGTASGDVSVGFDVFNGGVSRIRGSSYDDLLTGSAVSNTIEGGGGNDIIRGGAGGDKLDGGEYMDGISASGMNDFDWLDYSSATSGISVTLQAVTFSLQTGSIADHTKFLQAKDGLGGTDVTRGFEGVIGSKFADTMTGGISVFEVFQGGAGNDTIWGIGGMDIASYVDGTAGITVNLALGTFSVNATAAGLGIDSLKQIEGIYGTAFNDTYDASAFWFGDTGGVNIFRGGGGNDIIIGNTKAFEQPDPFPDGVGRTIIDYSDATAGMTINLTLGKVDGSHASVGIDTFSGGINGIIGTNYDDVLIGGQADRNRTAFETNSARFETFDGGKGNDFIDGGSGFDYVFYNRGIGALQTKGIHVMLADGIVIGDTDVFGTDMLRGIEIIVGTQLDDIFDARGFGLNSTNSGYDSRDYGLIPVIDEVPGAYNEFTGGAGNDLVYGNGYTLLRYSSATGGITADLTKTTGAINGNISVGIDSIGEVGQVRSIIGTDYADVVIGNAFDNYIQGGFSKTSAGDDIDGREGNDFIQGGSGDDKITGGTGDDIMGGGSPLPGTGQVSSNDTFYFEAGHGRDTIYDFNLSAVQGEHDVIVLNGTALSSFAELQSFTKIDGSFTYIDTDGSYDQAGDVIIINTPSVTAYIPVAQDFIINP